MAAFVAEIDAQPAKMVAAQRRALEAGRPPGHDGFATHVPAARKESS